MSIPRFLRAAFENYEIIDFRELLQDGRIEIFLKPSADNPVRCHRCKKDISVYPSRGKHRLRLESLPILGLRVFVHVWREKRHCPSCKKARSEAISFVARETPHLTEEFAFWIGRLCEIGAVSRVAELLDLDETTIWRMDFARMKRMLAHYRIPEVTHISVDEVYARKKKRHEFESRDDRFFTIICDLKTRRVIWVSESRRKEALDQFFLLIGKAACKKIEVVAVDQHEGYAASVREHCPRATLVWDKFHILQAFQQAVNDTRMQLHSEQGNGSELHRLTRGAYRYLFLKKASRRTDHEKTHINDVLSANQEFAKLEIIKERMLSFFNEQDESGARTVFDQIGDWIYQAGFRPLIHWYKNLEGGWKTLKNYFRFRVTSGLAEGINNVIKTLKRRAYGYRNMEYFRLKILQQCGYLNSRYIPHPALLEK